LKLYKNLASVQQKELFTLVNDSNFDNSLAFNPTSQYLAGGNSENTLIIWNLLNKQEKIRFTGFQSFVFSIFFTFDGH
jgi:WD40 repeat protein